MSWADLSLFSQITYHLPTSGAVLGISNPCGLLLGKHWPGRLSRDIDLDIFDPWSARTTTVEVIQIPPTNVNTGQSFVLLVYRGVVEVVVVVVVVVVKICFWMDGSNHQRNITQGFQVNCPSKVR